jgi:CxxC-x17-CxxC domain-containing protein
MIADLTLTCTDCQAEFVFSTDEQSFYQGQGFKSAPKRCKHCRRARRSGERPTGPVRRGTPARASFRVSCAGCGTSTHVPFEPDPMRPAFCRTCYQRRRRR